jgi:predicted RNase H-like HicB family nuclease
MRKVILRSGEDGWWVVDVPSLPGCITQGRSRDEALVNIREAIDLWLEDAQARGEAVPTDDVVLEVCVV